MLRCAQLETCIKGIRWRLGSGAKQLIISCSVRCVHALCRRYRESDLVLLDVKINGEMVEPLAAIVHRDASYYVGKALVKRLKELIPRQQFRVPIQAAIGARVVASGAPPPGGMPGPHRARWVSLLLALPRPTVPFPSTESVVLPPRCPCLAAESIPAMRKDVLAKCYGGDISRKKKLLKKQVGGAVRRGWWWCVRGWGEGGGGRSHRLHSG